MTYFYKVFRRYTHFSQESITIPVDGPQELRPDKSVRVRAKIPRHADLMTDLMLVLQLPEIYSKVYEQAVLQQYPSFRWIHMIGAFMIANIAVIVGGSKVQEFPGEWLAVRATADMPLDKYLKWRSMVGDVPEMHSPEWGVYGKSPNYPFQKGEYPHAQADASSASIQVAPSINGRELRIPLPLWFTESIGTALPLIALQLHEVEVQIDFRPLTDIFRLMDEELSAEPLRPDMRLAVDSTKPTQYDPTVGPPYDNLTLQNNYEAATNPCYSLRTFMAPPDVDDNLVRDTFPTNVHLEGNYVYLTEKERIIFAERELSHLVLQVQRFRYPSIRGRAQLDMDIHGLAHRIIFFARRSDALGARNDFINLSNWKSLAQAPYWPLSAASGVPNTGRAIQYYNAKHILRSARVLMAGNEIFEEKPVGYFELQTPFTSLMGSGATGLHPGAIKPDDIMGPLYHIPFALNASDHEQPSGSLNTSMVREIQLEVNPAPLDPAAPYSYDFTIYVETLNTVKFLNGMAGLAFAI